MDREIEFSRRFVAQLQKILTFYDERNGSSAYSRRPGTIYLRGGRKFIMK